MTYTLIMFDSPRLRDKYIRQVGWRGFANSVLHVWDAVPYAHSGDDTKSFDRVRAIGTDPDMLTYAEEYSDFLGAEFGSYPRVSSQDKDDRPQDYDAGSVAATEPDKLDGQKHKYKTLHEMLVAQARERAAAEIEAERAAAEVEAEQAAEAAAEALPGDSDDD